MPDRVSESGPSKPCSKTVAKSSVTVVAPSGSPPGNTMVPWRSAPGGIVSVKLLRNGSASRVSPSTGVSCALRYSGSLTVFVSPFLTTTPTRMNRGVCTTLSTASSSPWSVTETGITNRSIPVSLPVTMPVRYRTPTANP